MNKNSCNSWNFANYTCFCIVAFNEMLFRCFSFRNESTSNETYYRPSLSQTMFLTGIKTRCVAWSWWVLRGDETQENDSPNESPRCLQKSPCQTTNLQRGHLVFCCSGGKKTHIFRRKSLDWKKHIPEKSCEQKSVWESRCLFGNFKNNNALTVKRGSRSYKSEVQPVNPSLGL